MSGTVLENLSGKKLTILVSFLLISQTVCFLIGGLIAPKPAFTDSILATKCLDDKNSTTAWYYVRGKNPCVRFNIDSYTTEEHLKYGNQIVFAFQIPSPRGNVILDYSRWQQNLIGILHLDILYRPESEMPPRSLLTVDARLAYRNKGDPPDIWTYYASSTEQRILECSIDVKKEDYLYNCSIVPLFELGSLHHDFYLINIRLPVDYSKGINTELGHIADMWIITINQTGGFTKVWLSLKSIFFPSVLAVLIWFLKRVYVLQRKPLLLEYMLILVATSLSFLNIPLELLTLYFELPFMLLLADIRQGIFYAALLSFWLVFAGEHLMIQESQKNHLLGYWKHLSSVIVGCIAMFFFDLCERGIQLRNPFYSVWVTDIGAKFAMAFLIVGGISGVGYFFLLCYMIWKVFGNIGAKKCNLPAMSQARRLHYSGLIYRFNFLMLTTITCAAFTVITFALGQMSEGQWKWDDQHGLEYTSAFFTGVYGMWNIYIMALLALYAPSHKRWPQNNDAQNTTGEIEFSTLEPEPSEISSLTTFTRKTALD
ncbi:wnt ligand secretion mediator [Rhodnius prolixus]|uniref:wnt ligand secretion mediator n=1 Tax=Rhodnius prolixus TaxID=13249 RepID=UPI003D18A607